MTLVAITGTPGTGKSTLANYLEKELTMDRIDISEKYKEISTKFNKNKQCYDVDLKKLKKLVQKEVKEKKTKSRTFENSPLEFFANISF